MTDNASGKRPTSRLWRREDRAMISVMEVFRSSHEAHDFRKTDVSMNEQEGTTRARQRREGISETQLRLHLEADLNALLNTIRLGAAIPLDDVPHVQRSILNYGFRDLSSVSASELNTPQVVNSIRQSLIDHEPRLVKDSIEVEIQDRQGDTAQRLSIRVTAELIGDPVDIPVNFDAEVDLGAGKLNMSKLQVQL